MSDPTEDYDQFVADYPELADAGLDAAAWFDPRWTPEPQVIAELEVADSEVGVTANAIIPVAPPAPAEHGRASRLRYVYHLTELARVGAIATDRCLRPGARSPLGRHDFSARSKERMMLTSRGTILPLTGAIFLSFSPRTQYTWAIRQRVGPDQLAMLRFPIARTMEAVSFAFTDCHSARHDAQAFRRPADLGRLDEGALLAPGWGPPTERERLAEFMVFEKLPLKLADCVYVASGGAEEQLSRLERRIPRVRLEPRLFFAA